MIETCLNCTLFCAKYECTTKAVIIVPSSTISPSHIIDSVYDQQQKQWEAWRNNLLANTQTPNAAFAPPNVATATGGIGQDGNIQQTVSLLPENAANPNVKVQHTVTGGPGYVGVSTASFSSTSDVNGVQTQRKGAYTTVNDNGKITTYKLE